jgi:hypothetical protein
MTLVLDDWLGVIGREYVESFIPAGGGGVRFAVADGAVLERVGTQLRQMAAQAGLHVVAVDLAATKLHMLQNLFFTVATALPWEAMLRTRLASFLEEAGYRAPDRATDLEALAASISVAPHLLRRQFNQWLTRNVWRDRGLAQDFRHAMIALLTAQLTGEDEPLAAAVMEWLQGTLRSVAPLRHAHIGARIGRQNARAMLMSVCHWVRACGGKGILLLLDIRRLNREPREVADGLRYSPAAVMDCYEVLRQVIDDAEHFSGLFLVALADEQLLNDNPRRSLMQYTALQMRVADDVHPHERDNPLAPLVRLAA